MRKIILLSAFLFLITTHAILAQKFTKIENAEIIQEKIQKVSETIFTIKSNFVQEKYLSFMTEPIVSEGIFRFKKENLLRWEYIKPFSYLIVFNNDKIIIKDNNKTNEFDANSNAVFKQINGLMLGAIRGSLGANEDFSMELKQSSKQYLLSLTPENESVRNYISRVDLYFEKSDYSVSAIKMIEPTGDYTKIVFKNRIFNEPIDENTFKAN